MSITQVLSSAVSALQLNANRVAAAADNVANARTDGYKAVDVQGATVATKQGTATSYAAGGVRAVSRAAVAVQGLLQPSPASTDLAISGQGFFAVQETGSGGTVYTRAGSFSPDSQGFLVNAAGHRLLGRPTDAQGTVTSEALRPINLQAIGGTAEATSRLTLGANLPADAPVGGSERITAQIHDSLGNPITVTLEFTRAGANRYTLGIGDPIGPGGGVAGTAEKGGAGGGAYTVGVLFNSDGGLAGFDQNGDGTVDAASAPALYVGGPATGAADLNVALNLGTAGGHDGLTQFGSDFSLGFVDDNGGPKGEPAGVVVGQDGTVTALFDNGATRPVYRVPLATFSNPSGLDARTGNVYVATEGSGAPVLGTAGEGPAGEILGGAREQSTVDVGTEMVRTILASTAYKASLATIRTADEMQRDLLDTKA